MGGAVQFARQALGSLEQRFDGGGLEQRQRATGKLQSMREVGGGFLAAKPNTLHLTIRIALTMSTGLRGLAWRGRSGKLLILRLTPRGLRRPRLEATRSCRISPSTRS